MKNCITLCYFYLWVLSH